MLVNLGLLDFRPNKSSPALCASALRAHFEVARCARIGSSQLHGSTHVGLPSVARKYTVQYDPPPPANKRSRTTRARYARALPAQYSLSNST